MVNHYIPQLSIKKKKSKKVKLLHFCKQMIIPDLKKKRKGGGEGEMEQEIMFYKIIKKIALLQDHFISHFSISNRDISASRIPNSM